MRVEISMDGKDGGARVWRFFSERFDSDYVAPTRQWSPGLMVWGCFALPNLGPIIIIDGTLNGPGYIELIEQHVYPTMLAMFDKTTTPALIDLYRSTQCAKISVFSVSYGPPIAPT